MSTYINFTQADINENDGLDLRGRNLESVRLSGETLTNCDFRGCSLRGADLSNCDLTGSDFTGASLWDANLSGANLTGCKFRCADLWSASFKGANCTGANFSGADIGFTNFAAAVNANLEFADELNACPIDWSKYETKPDNMSEEDWGAFILDLEESARRATDGYEYRLALHK